MKFESLNEQIDEFFDSITPNEVLTLFEEIGYEFDRALEKETVESLKE